MEPENSARTIVLQPRDHEWSMLGPPVREDSLLGVDLYMPAFLSFPDDGFIRTPEEVL